MESINDRIAELELQLADAASLHQRIDLLNALAFELRFTDLPRSILLCEEAERLSVPSNPQDSTRESTRDGEYFTPLKQPYLTGQAVSQYHLGVFHTQAANYQQALSYHFKALLIAELTENLPLRANVLHALGVVYTYLGDYPTALEQYFKIIHLAEEMQDRSLQASASVSIGHLYMHLEDWPNALMQIGASMELCKSLGDRSGQAAALDNMCNCYRALGDFENAAEYGRKSIHLYTELGDKQGESGAHISLGELYLASSAPRLALDEFERALNIANDAGLRHEIIRIHRNLGDTWLRLGQRDPAQYHLHLAELLAEQINATRQLYECHQSLAEFYKYTGDFQNALRHYERFHELKERIFNVEADSRLKTLEVTHDLESSRHEVETSHLRTLALQREIRERQQAEQELQFTLQRLQHAMEERERLIAELDTFAQMAAHDLKTPLNNILLSTALLSSALPEGLPDQALEPVDLIAQMANKMTHIIDEMLIIASVRQQHITLRILNMKDILVEVEKRLGFMFNEYTAEIVKPESWPAAFGHAPWIEAVWTNYISNALKYGGRPPRVELGATLLPSGWIRFWVLDNGDGIPPQAQEGLFTAFTRLDKERAKGHGLGLFIVKRIMEKLGGEVVVESDGLPGHGCKFSFDLPGVRE